MKKIIKSGIAAIFLIIGISTTVFILINFAAFYLLSGSNPTSNNNLFNKIIGPESTIGYQNLKLAFHADVESPLDRFRLAKLGIYPNRFIFQQGEAESAILGYSGKIWANAFVDIVISIRSTGNEAPIFVAQSTICGKGNKNRDEIRWAQAEVVKMSEGVIKGPDTDIINLEDRYDLCHLSAIGQQEQAKLWAAVLSNYFLKK